MSLKDLFKDNNDVNEKTVIGFISFGLMTATMIIDLITGYLGKPLVINQYVYDSFLYITLGVFGIASVDKFINRKNPTDSDK